MREECLRFWLDRVSAAIGGMVTFGKAPASEGGRYMWIARGGRVYYDADWR